MFGKLTFCAGVFLCCHAAAQTGLVVSTAGYSAPESIAVAPGQVITLFVHAGGDPLDARVTAGPGRLPTSLAGFSVMLLQTFPSDPVAVPMFAVDPVNSCSPAVPGECVSYFALTVQIPFELSPNIPHTGRPANYAALRVSRGDSSGLLLLDAKADSIHIANSCDLNQQLSGGCYPIVTHSDGTVVSRRSPAKVGETLTANVVGLGMPVTMPNTGDSSGDAVTVDGVRIAFEAKPNSSASDPGDAGQPLSAVLAPGAIGTYQVMFQVPSVPSDLPACDATVKSNLTVSIGRMTSFDGAAICVEP